MEHPKVVCNGKGREKQERALQVMLSSLAHFLFRPRFAHITRSLYILRYLYCRFLSAGKESSCFLVRF